MKRTALTLIIMLMAAVSAAAQLTLEECRALAREHYPAIRQYDLVSASRDFTLSNAGKAYLPQVTVGAQASWQNAVATFPEQLSGMIAAMGADIPGIQRYQYQISVQIDQTIWDGGRTRAQKDLVEAESAQQARALDIDFYSLEKRIDDIYFGILMLDNRIGRAESLVSLLEDNLRQVRSMVGGGVAMQSDADALEAESITARQTLSRLHSARESYQRVLELFIGREIGGDTLEEPEMPSLSAGAPRPELELLDAQIFAADARQKTVEASVYPRFSLFAQSWYGYPGLDMFKSMMSTSGSFNAIVGVRMIWNVSSLYTRSNQLRQIVIAKQQAEVRKDIFTFNTTLRNLELDSEISRLRESLSGDERIAELRRGIRQVAESRYRAGVIPLSELLSAIHDEDAAENARTADALELLKTLYEKKHDAL